MASTRLHTSPRALTPLRKLIRAVATVMLSREVSSWGLPTSCRPEVMAVRLFPWHTRVTCWLKRGVPLQVWRKTSSSSASDRMAP